MKRLCESYLNINTGGHRNQNSKKTENKQDNKIKSPSAKNNLPVNCLKCSNKNSTMVKKICRYQAYNDTDFKEDGNKDSVYKKMDKSISKKDNTLRDLLSLPNENDSFMNIKQNEDIKEEKEDLDEEGNCYMDKYSNVKSLCSNESISTKYNYVLNKFL